MRIAQPHPVASTAETTGSLWTCLGSGTRPLPSGQKRLTKPLAWAVLALRYGRGGSYLPWPARPLRIAPPLSSSHFLRGHLEMDLEPGQGPGLRTVFVLLNRGWWFFFLLTRVPSYVPHLPLCTSSLFISFFHCLPPTLLSSQSGLCKERAGGGPVRVFASPGHLVSSATSLPCFPPWREGTARDVLHLGRHPTSGQGLPGSVNAAGFRRTWKLVAAPREAVGRCCLSQRSFRDWVAPKTGPSDRAAVPLKGKLGHLDRQCFLLFLERSCISDVQSCLGD